MNCRLTSGDVRQSLNAHVEAKGIEAFCKYGAIREWDNLRRFLTDTDFVRYPCEIVFAGDELLPGEVAHAAPNGERSETGFRILLHPALAARPVRAIPMVLYQLVAVNYGEFASADDAETFGAAALGLTRDEYYNELCGLVDALNSPRGCSGAVGAGV